VPAAPSPADFRRALDHPIATEKLAVPPRLAIASSLATRYNGSPHPAEVFIHPGGGLELARAREQVS
jgi:hypothetical protein